MKNLLARGGFSKVKRFRVRSRIQQLSPSNASISGSQSQSSRRTSNQSSAAITGGALPQTEQLAFQFHTQLDNYARDLRAMQRGIDEELQAIEQAKKKGEGFWPRHSIVCGAQDIIGYHHRFSFFDYFTFERKL